MNHLKSTLFITLIILGSSLLKPVWAQNYVGNLYIQPSTETTVDLTNSGDEISERFTMLNPTNNVITLYISNSITGTPNPTYSIGIQTDNGSGKPSGNWAAGPTTTTLPNSWNTVAVSSAPITQGKIYHLVIQVSTATANSGQFIFWTPDNLLIPNGPVTVNGSVTNGPVTDSELAYLINPGGASGWSVEDGNPTFGLGFSDGSVYGAPYASSSSNFIYASGSVTQQAAQLFSFPSNIYFGSVGAYVQKSGTPADNLGYYLVNASLGTTIVFGTLTTSGGILLDLTNQWEDATCTATTLSAGITYRLILESNLSTSSTAGYNWVNYGTIPALNPATYGGSALSAQTSSGVNTWANVADSDSSFRLGLVATPTPTMTSTPTNTPTPTITPTPDPTPVYDASDLGKAVLAPVPAPAGTKVCVYFDKPPVSCAWDVFNVMGQRVASLSFAQMQGNCWDTTGVPPGVYFVEIKITYQDGTTAQIVKKAVISQ